MDGFFISGRVPDPEFTWGKLEGAEVVMFKGGQPNVMFQYACHKAGIDYDKIMPITPGGASEIDKAFRNGHGKYIQQQGPFPQQLDHDGIGHIVTLVGPKIGRCAFSRLAASREWFKTDMAKAFVRAYEKARSYLHKQRPPRSRRLRSSTFPMSTKVHLHAALRHINSSVAGAVLGLDRS
jgi:ABC-type nitrate/sulfonate/bicarbonate transport system substrate-binding protein